MKYEECRMEEIHLKINKINDTWQTFNGIRTIYLLKELQLFFIEPSACVHLLTDTSLLFFHGKPLHGYRPLFQYRILVISIEIKTIHNRQFVQLSLLIQVATGWLFCFVLFIFYVKNNWSGFSMCFIFHGAFMKGLSPGSLLCFYLSFSCP